MMRLMHQYFFDKKNFASIEGASQAIYRTGHFTDEELEYIIPVFEKKLAVNLSWWAVENDDYLHYSLSKHTGINVFYYATEDLTGQYIFRISIKPQEMVIMKGTRGGLDSEFGFQVQRLYSFNEIEQVGGFDAFDEILEKK